MFEVLESNSAVIEKDCLINIEDVEIDTSLNKEERIKEFIKKCGNPYHFRVGEVEVTVSFESEGETLQKKMERYFESMVI